MNAVEQQLFWMPFMLILLGVGILTHGIARRVCVAGAIGGSAGMGVALIILAVTG